VSQLRFAFGDLTKRCRGCGEVKAWWEFHLDRGRRGGLQDLCKPCNIERNKRWYREHPEARPQRMNAYARARRERHHARVLAYLTSHPCMDCGENDPVVLEFDHLHDKVANVSEMLSRSWAAILAEIEKCDVVCANCHRRRTAERLGSFRFRSAPPPQSEVP
jgi:hypothetical protein